MVMILCLISICLTGRCQKKIKGNERMVFGSDVVSIIRNGRLDFFFGYGFSDKWSAAAEAGIDLRMFGPGYDEEETAHSEEFKSAVSEENDEDTADFHTIRVTVQFWPKTVFRGPFISLGSGWGDRTGLGCAVGAGYAFRIWKSIGAAIGYETGIYWQDGKCITSGDGIKIGISYMF